jgi:tRNA(Ile)-lysidine synthase
MIEQSHFDRILASLDIAGKRLLLAVSGGVDSMVMADLFVHALPIDRFAIAHCNFHLRGADSDADEALVEEYARRQGVIFIKKDFETKEYAAANGVSIEMAARELRYSWFEEVCEKEGFHAVAVAHNQNDNAETLMLNLLRGCGISGMTGMRFSSKVPVRNAKALLLRPMLEFSRKDIHEYAISHGIEWREDKTNSDSAYKRNLVRNEVFPLFEKLNPSFLDTISKDMQNLSQAQRAADAWCDSLRKELIVERPDVGFSISIQKLKSFPAWEYFIFRILNDYGFGSAEVEDMVQLLKSGEGVAGRMFFSSGYSLATSSNHLILSRKQPEDSSVSVQISSSGEYVINKRKFVISLLEYTKEMPLRQPEGIIAFDAEKAGFPLKIRSWRDGDWMRPLGVRTMSGKPGRKKLQDLFTDLKFNILEKKDALVLEAQGQDGSHVAAVLCCRIDDSIKITPATHRIIRIAEAGY